jgi:hypothetical protein
MEHIHISEEEEHLNTDHQGKCIGQGIPVAWAAVLPDFDPAGLFMWGCMKFKVCHTSKPETRQQLLI